MSTAQPSLKDLLEENQQNICQTWQEAILSSYPAESAAIFRRQKSHTANPVGYRVIKATEGLFAQLLLEHGDQERILALMDDLISVRAVQDFTPSQALAFVPQLKAVIRHELAKELAQADAALLKDLYVLETRVDALALSAFDVYTKCRERLWSVKYNDLRNSTHILLKKSGMLSSFPPM